MQKENYWELQIFLTHSASPPFLFHALWHNFLVLSQSVRYYYNFSTNPWTREYIFALKTALLDVGTGLFSLFLYLWTHGISAHKSPPKVLFSSTLCLCRHFSHLPELGPISSKTSKGAPPYFAKSNFNKEAHLDIPLIFNYGKIPSQIPKNEWTFLEHVKINGWNSVCV